MSASTPRWDIFCAVVDNYGDLGVAWRLARQIAREHGFGVRLWVDDLPLLARLAPELDPAKLAQTVHGVDVRVWDGRGAGEAADPAEVVVEAFGCGLPAGYLAAMAARARQPVWINLEYLSAESWIETCHGLASRHPTLPLTRYFFFPGFTADTGGLLREPDLLQRRLHFDRAAWLASQGIAWAGEPVVSLFCYEPPVLGQWLAAMARSPRRLLVTDGRAACALRGALAAMPASWNRDQALKISFLPLLSQVEFDHLLWAADANFVRGEDSLVRALWSGAALVWQAYAQSDAAHHAKLDAFLDWLQAPASLRRYHGIWNGIEIAPLPDVEITQWRAVVEAARARLLAQEDLVSRLLGFVAEKLVK